MAKNTVNNIRLGVFVLTGVFFLILLLYMIGKSENMFGAKYMLKAHFDNVQGLVPGNNVRYGGIVAGTVKEVRIINDTTVEVIMLVKTDMKKFIRKDAIASIGTDGLMGNKLVNITASGAPAVLAEEGDLLASRAPVDTDEMLRVLNSTNSDIAVIAGNLKATIQRVNNSTALWSVLEEPTVPANLKATLVNVRRATERTNEVVNDLQWLVQNVKEGNGSLGAVLTDTSLVTSLEDAIGKIREVGNHADTLSLRISSLIAGIQRDVNQGNGMAHAILKDTGMVYRLNNTLIHIEKGTEAFSQNMEALKTNFLFRGYFKRQERQKKQFGTKLSLSDSNGKLSTVN
ncbi:MAG TPA: MlaD family protein [Chitinophagaceae bacterium]